MKRSALFALASLITLSGTVPAIAEMHNPNTVPWPDHSKPVRIGVDIAPQHFGVFTITPKGNGHFSLDLRCENGQRGSRTDGTLHLVFLGGSQELKTADQYCRVDRNEFDPKQEFKNYHQDLDLSGVIDKITHIKISAKATWYPPQRNQPPRPRPPGDQFRQPGQPPQ